MACFWVADGDVVHDNCAYCDVREELQIGCLVFGPVCSMVHVCNVS